MDLGPFEIQTPTRGTLRMRMVSMRDMRVIDELLDEPIQAREFTCRVIHHQLQTPEIALDTLRMWDDESLVYIARTWLEENPVRARGLPNDLPPFEGFRQVLRDAHHEARESFRRLTEQAHKTVSILQVPHHLLTDPRPSVFDSVTKVITEQEMLTRQLDPLGRTFNCLVGREHLLNQVLPGQDLVESARIAALGFSYSFGKLAAAVQGISDSLRVGLEAGRIFQGLPDPRDFLQRFQRQFEAGEALEEVGFGIAGDLWAASFYLHLPDIPEGVRAAAMTNRLVSVTRHETFGEEMREIFTGSAVLRRRWAFVEPAWEAHRRREYVLSVPALLAQVEGALSDLLILRGEAVVKNGRVFARGSDGRMKLNHDKKPVEMTGLKKKIDHSRLKNDPVLQSVVDLLTSRLISERNDVLHGRTAYPQAKLSTQALLLLLVLGREFAELQGTKAAA